MRPEMYKRTLNNWVQMKTALNIVCTGCYPEQKSAEQKIVEYILFLRFDFQ
jgi:hypothetical protein